MEVQESVLTVLQYNTVAGSERAGYRIDGEACPGGFFDGLTDSWMLNTAHSSLIGVLMLPGMYETLK